MTEKRTIQFIFEYEVEATEDEAEFMEMTVLELLAYKIDSLKEYREDRMDAVSNSTFKGINNVD